MTECVFCDIAAKKASASLIYEDDDIMAFLDINPLQKGHTLVIPKKHFVDIWDIPSDVLAGVASVAKRVAQRMASAMRAEGINTFSASGRPAGQEINHFHMHVIPLREGERTKFAEWWSSRVRSAERSELDALAAKLRLQ